MRTTTTIIEPETLEKIKQIVDKTATTKDFTLAVDFACDAYALFAEEFSKRSVFKTYWDLFDDVKKLYTFYQLGNLMDSFNFYTRIQNFFKYFIYSELFRELDKLDPLEATEHFLNMFKPKDRQPEQQPQPKKQQQQQQQQDQNEDEDGGQDQPQTHQSGNQDSEDQKGLSTDEDNLPIDMGEFKKQMPNIEKALETGALDREDFQAYMQQAGVGSNNIHIKDIGDIVKQLANRLSKRELDIFYVARQKELTEVYRRDEELNSVEVPDNEMSVKDMENHQEILKILPNQFALDDDVFAEKLAKKELQVRDYQSRKLKKQALYMLIDVSGSMSGGQSIYASAVGLALVRQAIDEGSTYFLRFFDDEARSLNRIETKEEAKKMAKILAKQPYSGGGTSIQHAINVAVRDINNDKEKFDKVEIMVITDGNDSVSLDKSDLKGIKVHSTVIGGENNDLKRISETYTRLNVSDLPK